MRLKLLKKPEKAPKYKNKKIVNRFGSFASMREWNRYKILHARQRCGVISNLRRQVKYELVPKVKFRSEARAKPAIRYYADFVYDDEWGAEVIEDAKGRVTKDYRLKKHLMKALLQKEIIEV